MDRAAAARTLGVAPNASPALVKKAYHALAREHHPDKKGDDDGGEAFKRVKDAYDVLTGAAANGPSVPARPCPPAPPTRAVLPVTLDDIYARDCTRVLQFARTRYATLDSTPCSRCST